MKTLFQKYKHVWILSYTCLYIPWFMYLEKKVTGDYHVMHITLDNYIPFNEYFIIPYLLWFFYVAGAILYLFFKNKEDYYRLCTFLFIGMTASLIICTIFPNGTNFRPIIDPDKNLFTFVVAKLYAADTCTNVFPSIHVYNSIGIHIAVMHNDVLRNNRLIHIGSFLLMVSICLATVFLKQHSAIDGFASILMAYFFYTLVYGGAYAINRKKVREKALN